MIGDKSVLALIPARGGSKGVPGKNIRRYRRQAVDRLDHRGGKAIALYRPADPVDRRPMIVGRRESIRLRRAVRAAGRACDRRG